MRHHYDALNRWVAKEEDLDGDWGTTGDVHKTWYAYDGSQIALAYEQRPGGPQQLTHRYFWGPGVDHLLADEQWEYDGSGHETLWALGDHLGTVRDLIDSGGTIRKHTAYDAFGNRMDEQYWDSSGNAVTAADPSAVDTLFGFTGRPLDEATGLQNNLNRWYDSKAGKWISEDPIGFSGGDANLYRYVGNAPTTSRDPFGLVDWVWPWNDRANLNVRDNLHFWTWGFLPDQAEYDALNEQATVVVGVCPNPEMLMDAIRSRLQAMGYAKEVQQIEIALFGPVADPAYYDAEGNYNGPAYGYPPVGARLGNKSFSATASNRGLTIVDSGVAPRKVRLVPNNPLDTAGNWGVRSAQLNKHFFGNSKSSLTKIDPGGTPDCWMGHISRLFSRRETSRTANGMIDIIGEFPRADGSGVFKLGVRLAPNTDGTFDLVTILTKQ